MKLIIGIVVLIIGVFLFLRTRGRRGPIDEAVKAELRDTTRLKAEFHAVSIRPGTFACKAARELEGERFLSGTAPRIPLPDCDSSDCSCRFAHHDDRRKGDDRRSPFPPTVGLDAGSIGSDQRTDSDRRRETGD